jgi:prepilin-type N-terminal cleavage/methylation domain-containing protein
MKTKFQMARRKLSAGTTFNLQPTACNRCWAFTLVELLVVISIMGILAALSVPTLKNLGKSNVQASAARQMLDDVGRARQLAMSHHATVYMVFVPQNFWTNATWWGNLDWNCKAACTNILDKQYTGYTFISLRSVGDQPGQITQRHLTPWQTLPEGSFIQSNKFYAAPTFITNGPTGEAYPIEPFHWTNKLPFPTETNLINPSLPYIAFNYLGQLTADGTTLADRDEFIPLAQGNVSYPTDGNKVLQRLQPTAVENPPGSSTNSMFALIRIDRLTGRASLLHQKMP